jgi:oligopeptide/dipeptide ABC transporter ATP-binding protein
MYAGQIAELAPAASLFAEPRHPYTVGLMNSFPSVTGPRREMRGIPGSPPDLAAPPGGCRFHPRCPHAMALCRTADPVLTEERTGRKVACHLYPPSNEPQARC